MLEKLGGKRVVLARAGGICPLCTKYIAKHRSHIVALDRGEYAENHRRECNHVRMCHIESNFSTPRLWVHRACYAKLLKKETTV